MPYVEQPKYYIQRGIIVNLRGEVVRKVEIIGMGELAILAFSHPDDEEPVIRMANDLDCIESVARCFNLRDSVGLSVKWDSELFDQERGAVSRKVEK